MKINRQSNLYTVIYITLIVLIVGTALAFTSLKLKGRQQENIDADKMRQILASVHIVPEKAEIVAEFNKVVVSSPVYNAEGRELSSDGAFDVDVNAESRKPASERSLPLFVCRLADGSTKYVIPLYGAGLWGPIWGYVALNDDADTVYGAFFAHQGETPGLGAEIEKPKFCNEFDGKHMFKDDKFMPVTVVKAGTKPADDADYVDGVSGGTITSKGVAAMLDNCIAPYRTLLETLKNK